MQEDNTYNGYTNYATWRVNMEVTSDLIDHWLTDLGAEEFEHMDAENWAEDLRGEVERYIEQDSKEKSNGINLAQSYAMAFIDKVNWHELGEHAVEATKEALES